MGGNTERMMFGKQIQKMEQSIFEKLIKTIVRHNNNFASFAY